jgi:uncharacterized protein (UPF0332 family)
MVINLKNYDFHDCIKEGLLRKIPPSKEKAEESINTAEKWLEEAEKGMENEAFNSSVMASYLAMFHSARAILFFDGFREKSHYCVARYLEEKYARKKLLENKWIELLDHYRDLRHDDQYSTTFFATKEEAENGIKKTEEFVERMKKLLRERQAVPKMQGQ